MDIVLVIVVVTCAAILLSVLVKPSVTVKGHTIGLYWAFALIGAFSLIIFGFLTWKEVFAGLTSSTSINPLKILILFLSMTSLSIFLDELGFFNYLANCALKHAGTSQRTLFLSLYIVVSILTVFTSNDIIILTFTPFICYFSKSAKINPLPFLFAEFVAANTWSMMLMIGNPTNVYLATANGIDFAHYFTVMALPTICGGTVAFLMLSLIFRKSLRQPMQAGQTSVNIKDKPLLIIGLVHLFGCTVCLILSSWLSLQMWLITFCFAISLCVSVTVCNLIRRKYRNKLERQEKIDSDDELKSCFRRLPWELIPFVVSMFVLVLALNKYGFTSRIGTVFGSSDTVMKYGVSSFLAANVINNIPMSVLFSSITGVLDEASQLEGVYAATVGSNIGAFFTPVGALAGIMWSGILKKQKVRFSFFTFLRYGSLIAVPTLLASLEGLNFVLKIS